MIIGIGGISNAGKSGLAEKIKAHYTGKNIVVLCQDNFARPTATIPKIKGHTNWEIPESLDFDRFYQEIINRAQTHDWVIAEGLFVFHEERLLKLYDKMIFMSISKTTFLKRKHQDLRWGKEPDWYVQHIWESHFNFCNRNSARQEAFQVSGENPVDLGSVFRYLEE